eukprot:CAMPEP_0115175084 /NCGR_PEP_ID=MMETSP0270-20121206/4175_1 /TAXON_ID=71861 /ORGANISM="Scrippsiella trochoidea, Strain CCMP3099" /LENGTH=37 /DNA_ID= /DNA_START= /DNA_END= /DNA_ORIENTATION=
MTTRAKTSGLQMAAAQLKSTKDPQKQNAVKHGPRASG